MPDVTPHAPLPIFEVLPQVRAALQTSALALLQAPTGAGKSTGLPLSALREGWLADWTGAGKILLLQPRRVAARAVAARMAAELGEEVGAQVGLRVRFETRVGPRTRLEVITEGILIRLLQNDPELTGVGLVIFDEFHERSLDADLGLALVREVQGALRDDLKVLVMSATLDPALPAQLDAPLIVSEGRSYPVEVRYLSADPADPVAAMPGVIARAAQEHEGDILAFLPGVRDIMDVQGALLRRSELSGLDILPLYGDLSVSEQQKALSVGERRRVILATNIAETSLTLPGVRVVVDSGLGRVQRFDPGTSLSRLVTERVSGDSATQRSGRAGRVAPGVAYRLWSERTHATLPRTRAPEILGADLAGLSLELAGWGSDAASLPWLDAPPPARLSLARGVLTELGALEGDRITALGAQLLTLPTHPRLARMLRGAGDTQQGALAADIAALLEERDPLARGSGADLTERLTVLGRFRQGQSTQAADRTVLERIERLSLQWRARLRVQPYAGQPEPYTVGRLLLLAYPERAAQSREYQSREIQPRDLQPRTTQRGRYLLASGQGAALPEGDTLAGEPYLVVAALDMAARGGAQFGGPSSGPNEGRIFLAAPLDPADLPTVSAQRVEWDSRTDMLSAQQEERYGSLVLASRPLQTIPEQLRVQAALQLLEREGLDALNWTKAAEQWQARVDSLRHWRGPEWPDVTTPALQADLGWLQPYLGQVRRRDDLSKVDLLAALQTLLPWNLTRDLTELAPTHLTVPSGHSVALEYRLGGEAPILAVKLQELFGLADTPTVNAGRTPVLLHLLSPARRPVQVTQDLRSFWQTGYFEIRKELRGQYPRHPWPDDPWTHAPTRATTRQMKRSGEGK